MSYSTWNFGFFFPSTILSENCNGLNNSMRCLVDQGKAKFVGFGKNKSPHEKKKKNSVNKFGSGFQKIKFQT